MGSPVSKKFIVSGKALLLQGPIGPFFSLLADELVDEGHEVFKIHFNGGDEAYYRHGNGFRYTGDLAGWPAFLDDFVSQHAIDRIFLFGDCRPYHRRAVEVARLRNVAVFVFEQGYLRPDYITLEPGGVNGYSGLSRDPTDYDAVDVQKQQAVRRSAGSGFWPVARHALRYYLAAWWARHNFPNYAHHRPLKPFREGYCWLRSGVRKGVHRFADRPLLSRLGQRDCRYYFAPLQVHCDAQMTHHSGGFTVEGFIAHTIRSFAVRAPADTELVFKHHPMDRAYYSHHRLIGVLARQYGVHGRVHYVHEGHLPTLLKGAVGTVVINSTVGLSSVLHRTPVKVLGDAVYDMPGLTCDKPLDLFWQEPGEVDIALYRRYRQYLVTHVLGNGNFHRRMHTDRGPTGIVWPYGSLTAATQPARAVASAAPVADIPAPTETTAANEGYVGPSTRPAVWQGWQPEAMEAFESHH